MKTTHFGSAQWTLRLRSVSKALTLCIMLLSPLFWRGVGGEVFAQGTGAGNCLSYNGNGNYTSVSKNYSTFLQINFTIEGWIMVPFGDNGAFFCVPYNSTLESSIDFYASPQLLVRLVFTATDISTLSSITSITDGKWHHVATTYDGSTHKIYVDGVLEASTAHSGNVRTGSSTQTNFGAIGTPYTSGWNALQSHLDEFRIWNRALTEPEIRDNMCKKLTGSESGLVGYWRFDEGSGGTVYDTSGNGNNGTLY